MSLLKCPECGHEVSSFADKCPNCGCPIAVIKNDLKAKEQTKQQQAEKEQHQKQDRALQNFLEIAENKSSLKDYSILKNQIDNGLTLDWPSAAEEESHYYEYAIYSTERPSVLYSGIIDAIWFLSRTKTIEKTDLTDDQIFKKLSSAQTIDEIYDVAWNIIQYIYPIVQDDIKVEIEEWSRSHPLPTNAYCYPDTPNFVREQTLPDTKKRALQWYAHFEASFIYEVIRSEEKRSHKTIVTDARYFKKTFIDEDPTDIGEISLNKNLTSDFALVADQVSLCLDIFTKKRQFIS